MFIAQVETVSIGFFDLLLVEQGPPHHMSTPRECIYRDHDTRDHRHHRALSCVYSPPIPYVVGDDKMITKTER